VAGERVWEMMHDHDEAAYDQEVDPNLGWDTLPWGRTNRVSLARWAFWRRRFEQEADLKIWDDEVRELAGRAAEAMASITAGHVCPKE